MHLHGNIRTTQHCLLTLVLILPAFFVSSCSRVQPPAPRKPPFPIVTADNLFAVDCVDRQHAWIVGFNAVIVCTADGGKTWEFQKSGVENNLCAVSFVTPAIGWISGRAGIMLHTTDGGKTWTKQQTGVTSHLFTLTFIDERNGWAAGELGTIIH
ncbi:MAG: YCF48-related protein, partial [Proteobacteria bacterium]|nr:YCF48-related protein [Pseudomonadota bacterium]